MVEIDLSGIFGIEILPIPFKQALAKAKGDDIEFSIASPGGDVFGAIEIYNAVSEYKAKYPKAELILKMNGIVASMGSYFSMNPSFSMVTAYDNASLMIHNMWQVAVGDHKEMRKVADKLEGLNKSYVELVSAKMNIPISKAEKLMDEETWFHGQAIVDNGFANEIINRPNAGKKNIFGYDPKILKNELAENALSEMTSNIAASIKPQQNANIDNNKNSQENKNVMDEKEKKEAVQAGASAEHARVSSIMALKDKYKASLKDKPEVLAIITDIIDKAIVNKEVEKGEVLADITAALSSGNIQAALESAGSTPQGSADTASGEQGKKPELVGESW